MDRIVLRTVQTAVATFFAVIANYLGIIVVPLIVLCVAMIIDYITGMISAWKNAKLSSKKGVFGIVKKICYLLLVCVGVGVDWLIYSGMERVGVDDNSIISFGVLVTVWLIINELISILENLGAVGVPLPGFLTAVVKKLKSSAESIIQKGGDENGENR